MAQIGLPAWGTAADPVRDNARMHLLSFLAGDRRRRGFLLLALLATGCAQLPSSGPSAEAVGRAASQPGTAPLQIVDVNERVARRLLSQKGWQPFSELLSGSRLTGQTLGAGDTLEVSIWEAPPATLFGSAAVVDPRQPSAARSTTLPEQMIDRSGYISVPFAGRVLAAGQTIQALEAEISSRLRGKANQPEVIVRVARNASSTVTVVGEVNTSLRVPLTAAGERVLDALAAAGGVRQPVSKVTLQLTRGGAFHAMPLDMIIRDPAQNVPLMPGDVVTALHQPYSFTALGATGKNEEINFEAQGITLAQALARAGGLQDSRSDARGVFIFRLESPNALDWPGGAPRTTPDGQVPVIYRLDLSSPEGFLTMQNFPIRNKDVLYVSNAPAAELQKFLNLVFSVIYPISATRQLFP